MWSGTDIEDSKHCHRKSKKCIVYKNDTLLDFYLKGKKSLDTVGSIKTIQAIGPCGPTLSAKKDVLV